MLKQRLFTLIRSLKDVAWQTLSVETQEIFAPKRFLKFGQVRPFVAHELGSVRLKRTVDHVSPHLIIEAHSFLVAIVVSDVKLRRTFATDICDFFKLVMIIFRPMHKEVIASGRGSTSVDAFIINQLMVTSIVFG